MNFWKFFGQKWNFELLYATIDLGCIVKSVDCLQPFVLIDKQSKPNVQIAAEYANKKIMYSVRIGVWRKDSENQVDNNVK